MSSAPVPGVDPQVHAMCEAFRRDYRAVQAEIAKAIVGHEEIVDGVLTCLFVGGHALLEGVPGLGKTALIRALASALNLKFNRIQFTPDLMPADVIGTNGHHGETPGDRAFPSSCTGRSSPDRAGRRDQPRDPKTQSALLEAMQEKQVTAGGEIRKLEEPFFVMATQNPLEQEGTYPLPEAQLDRFFYKLVVKYSSRRELAQILERTTTGHRVDVQPVLDGERIRTHQQLIKRVVIAPHVRDYIIRCTLATHPQASSRSRWSTSSSASASAPAPPRRSSWRARSAPCSTAGSTSASRT
jgi:MoxR-like ATPase